MQRRAAEESLTDHGKDNSNGRAHVGDAIRHKPGILGFLRQIGFMGATGKLLSQGKVLKMQRRAAEESLTDHGKDNSNGRAHVGDAIRHKPGILGFLRQIGFMGATGRRFRR